MSPLHVGLWKAANARIDTLDPGSDGETKQPSCLHFDRIVARQISAKRVISFLATTPRMAGNLQVSLVNGFVPAVGQSFTILDNTNLFGGNSGVFANAPGGVYTTADGMQFAVVYGFNADGGFIANDVTLFYLGTVVVPEPGTWTLLAVGTAGFAVVALRRRRARPGQA